MKIALLTPTFSYFSGIDRIVEIDAKEYSKKQKAKVTIFTFRASIKSKYANIVEIGMPKNPTLERIYRLFFFLDIKKIIKYTRMLKDYDIVISYFYPMTWLGYFAKKKYKKKYIYWDAGLAFPKLFSKLYERIYLRLFSFFTKLSARNADGAISISKFLQKQLKKQIGLNSKVKYVDVDKKRFHKKINGKKIREKYNLKNSPTCLYVGRISPHKGIHLLIDSFNLVLKKIPNAKLLIVGKHTFDNYSKKLKQKSNKNIIFCGFVPDKELPSYYAACDVYTTATLWEGFDIPIVEANLCGKKAVAFDLCSHPEVIRDGILVKPKDTKAFANAIITILKNKKE